MQDFSTALTVQCLNFGYYADDQTKKYSRKNDVASILWTRVYEAAGRLSVIYACSKSHDAPLIDIDTARWSCEFAQWTCEQMKLMIEQNLAETTFHATWLRIEDAIRSNGGHASQSHLINKLKISGKQLLEAIETMGIGQRISLVEIPTRCRPRMEYVLTDPSLE